MRSCGGGGLCAPAPLLRIPYHTPPRPYSAARSREQKGMRALRMGRVAAGKGRANGRLHRGERTQHIGRAVTLVMGLVSVKKGRDDEDRPKMITTIIHSQRNIHPATPSTTRTGHYDPTWDAVLCENAPLVITLARARETGAASASTPEKKLECNASGGHGSGGTRLTRGRGNVHLEEEEG